MGRRALRKIDPSLDLSRHLWTLAKLVEQWDAAALFACRAELEVEIGSGKGLFLAAAAASQPETEFLGIENSAKYARFAAARLAKRRLSNARVVHGDALRVFAEVLTEASVRAVHIYFPDPWWKARHKKRRIMRPSFVTDVERALEAGGELHFWTDVQEYFDTSVQLLSEYTGLEGPFGVVQRPADHDLDYRTHFERRMRQFEQPVYRALFRKRRP